MSDQVVQQGQIWKSADKRETRRVRVLDSDGHFATVYQIDASGLPMPGGKRSRIRLDTKGRLSRYRLED